MKDLLFWTLCLVIITQAFGQKKKFSYGFFPDVPKELVEDRISCIESDITLTYNKKVQGFVDYFSIKDREYTQKVLDNTTLYFPLIESELKKNALPDQLKYLAIVESGLNPTAISRVGAGGLWQFMPGTGRMMGLSKTWYIDQRMNPQKSTAAACKYLQQLYNIFHDWDLALAAYNSGPGTVRRAIRRSGYKKNFWEIYRYLPRETRSYVPQFIAITYIFSYYEEYGFSISRSKLQPKTSEINIKGYAHVETIAKQLDLCLDDLLKLNPDILRGAIPENVSFSMNIPADKLSYFKTNYNTIIDSARKVGKKELEYLARTQPGSTFGREKIIYRVRSGDVLGTIARRHRVRVSDLRKWNNIRGNLIKIGQRLNIWVLPRYTKTTKQYYAIKPGPSVSKSASSQPVVASVVPSTKSRVYVVKSGDSLWSISQKFQGISIAKIKTWNNLKTNRIDPGQKLIIAQP